MEILFWSIVFIAALIAIVKGADWLIDGAEHLGIIVGMSPFIIGVTIVALGTSLPELVAAFSALAKGVPEIVAANVIGSNVANIFLVIGISAIVARKLVVEKDLIDLDLPMVAAGTVIFLFIVWDARIVPAESAVLLLGFAVYLLYVIRQRQTPIYEVEEDISKEQQKHPKDFLWQDIGLVTVGTVGLALGANYLIESITVGARIFDVAPGVIAITAVAIGTSLPEAAVSVGAVKKGNTDVALGNIFGSNVFNLLLVAGLPGVFAVLPVDKPTMTIALPALIVATLLFVISGISRRIHAWEGSFYLLIYVLFIVKLFELF